MTLDAAKPTLCDPLTGALTRHRLEELLSRTLDDAAAQGVPTALLMIDIDHFKSVNDSFGHARGDTVLIEVVRRLNVALRDGDLLFRFGGDEFVLLLPLANLPRAQSIGSRLLDVVRREPFPGVPPLNLTLSIGVAAFPQDAATPAALFAAADRRVYQAKQAGRGRVAASDAPIRAAPEVAPERLIERDEALATLRDFLDTSGSGSRLLCLHTPPDTGRTRLLAELECAATTRGYATLAVRGGQALRARSYGALIEATQGWPLPPLIEGVGPFAAELARALAARRADRLLITIDDPQGMDDGSIDALRELAIAPALPPVLVAYVHGPAWMHRPPLDTAPHLLVALRPLSAQGLGIWLRQALRWEPPADLVAWVAAYSEGLPGRIRSAIDALIAHGALIERDGSWTWDARLATAVAPWFADAPAILRLVAGAPLLVGRDNEVALLRSLIADERLITVVGQGGVGKTRLALQAAAECEGAFRDGAHFVPLAGVAMVAHIPAAIAVALQLSPARSAEPQAQLMAYLRARNLLLVLDNVEHLLDGAQLLSELLDSAPGLRLLVTSRERLALPDERVVVLDGLALPASTAPAASAAAQLFLQQARQIVPAFVPSDDELRAIDQICHLLQGLPLGIELAASWIQSYSCQAILAELERGLAFLTSHRADLPARHRSITAVLDSFWEQLSVHERRSAQALAVFRGGFTREAARQVAGASPFLLDGLVAKTFLHRSAQGRFTIHELLRQYAGEQLRAHQSSRTRVYDRHSAYYLGLLAEAYPKPDDAAGSLDTLRGDLDNIRAAWGWVVAHMRDGLMAAALNGLADLMINNGLLQEGLEAIESALSRLMATGECGGRTLLAHLEATRSLLLYRLGRLQEGRVAGRQAEALLAGLSAPHVAARAHLSLGMVQYLLWDLEDSRGHLEQALALAAGDERLVVRVLNQLSEQAYGAGDRPASAAHAAEAIRRARAAGYAQDELRGLIMLGTWQLDWERHAEAEATFEQVRTHPATPRWVLIESNAIGYLAQVWWEVLEYTQAATAIERAVRLARRSGMRHLEGLGLAVAGRVALVSGNLARAEELFTSAMTIFQDLKTWRALGRVQSEFALVAHRRGEDDVALARCDAALLIARQHQLAVPAGHALIHRGHALLALGEPRAAAEAYRQGREQMLSIGRHNRAAEALAGLALAELALGRRDVAQQHGSALLTHLGGGWPALGGMFDPAWVCLAAYDVLCADDPQAAAAALAHGRAVLERISAQFTPERAEICVANIPSLRRISAMGYTSASRRYRSG